MKKRCFGIALFSIVLIIYVSCASNGAEQKNEIDRYLATTAGKNVNVPSATLANVEKAASYKKADTEEMSDEISADKPAGAKDSSKQSLSFAFLTESNQATGRYLEYNVSLTYETSDFTLARISLLTVIAKYGFIRSSSAVASGYNPYMNSELSVKASELYNVLKEMDKIGILKGENISLIDHTEGVVIAKRQMRREQIRILRKITAIGQVSGASRNWDDIEASVEESENNMDNAEHNQWKINDAVEWAKIHIYLTGPKVPNPIEVPMYQNALTDMLNYILDFLYLLIYLSPLIIIAVIIIIKRRAIMGIFKKKDK